jgi:hypothetical protein
MVLGLLFDEEEAGEDDGGHELPPTFPSANLHKKKGEITQSSAPRTIRETQSVQFEQGTPVKLTLHMHMFVLDVGVLRRITCICRVDHITFQKYAHFKHTLSTLHLKMTTYKISKGKTSDAVGKPTLCQRMAFTQYPGLLAHP